MPFALAAGVLLLIAQVVRIARREPPRLDVAVAEAPAPRAPQRELPPAVQPAREVLAVRASAGERALPEEQGREIKTPEDSADAPPAPAEPSRSEATPAAAAPAAIEVAPAPPSAAPAEPPASPASAVPEEAPAFGIEAILPTLSADEPEPAAPRAAPRSRRAKRPDPHAARAQGPLPRSIDETDPYLE